MLDHLEACRYLQFGQARSDELQKPGCGPQPDKAGSNESSDWPLAKTD